MRILSCALGAVAVIALTSCSRPVLQKTSQYSDRHDVHSFANPHQVRVTHVALDLTADFDARVLKGSATLTIDRSDSQAPLVLDTRDLKIQAVECSEDSNRFSPTEYKLGQKDKILGTPLTVELPRRAVYVRVRYETSPSASGLQWVTPAQTAGKKYPFLYSQSQAIHARSWIPLQDSPAVRVAYSAHIRTPKPLLAVMSAENDHHAAPNGDYSFVMEHPIPSYLIAIAVGDLRYHTYTKRAGVYAEAAVIDSAAREFEDLDKMIDAAERVVGRYRWEVYDLLVLPPSFPYGGMENPRLTFATPTLLAGDKSLVGVASHEIAHSWSGNLVTNATWRDFWLNEGFTTYIENRIQEQVYGPQRAEMEAALEIGELEREMAGLPAADQRLYLDLKGRDPDEGGTSVAYTKGALFLRRLEQLYGRDRFDPFLRGYFERFAFQSIVTGQFVDYLRENLLNQDPTLAATFNVDEWLSNAGLPSSAPRPASIELDEVGKHAKAFAAGQRSAGSLPARSWSTHEWLYFLNAIPSPLDRSRMAELDATFRLTATRNSEIAFQWLKMAIQSKYEPAYPRLERFLVEVGRRKYIKPLYTELLKTAEGRRRAEAIFKKARPGYHPISASAIEAVLKG